MLVAARPQPCCVHAHLGEANFGKACAPPTATPSASLNAMPHWELQHLRRRQPLVSWTVGHAVLEAIVGTDVEPAMPETRWI